MKKLIYLVLAIIIIIILVFVFGSKTSSAEIKDKAHLIIYTSNNNQIGKGLFYIEFAKDAPKAKADVFIDFDNSGDYSNVESVVTNFLFNGRKDWKTGIAVKLSSEIKEGTKAKVVLNGKEHIVGISVTKEEVGDLLDLETVTNPEESMKGWGNVVYAQNTEPATDAYRPGVSDITQKPAECAPTSAANSLISLATEHGKGEGLNPTDIINELKLDMDWTPENGALPNPFVQGKNEWAVKHNLPIRTTKVGDANGIKTLEKLLDGLAAGGAAELRITFGNAAGTEVVGGHMVTVTGVRIDGDSTFMTVSDPKTPEGEETYEIIGNRIEGYPTDGVAVLSWGFLQVWDEQAPTNLEPMTAEEIRGIKEGVGIKEKIKVLVIKGEYVPIAQVHVFKGDECDNEAHYHANNTFVTSINGVKIFDTGGCGYGKVKDMPVNEIDAP